MKKVNLWEFSICFLQLGSTDHVRNATCFKDPVYSGTGKLQLEAIVCWKPVVKIMHIAALRF